MQAVAVVRRIRVPNPQKQMVCALKLLIKCGPKSTVYVVQEDDRFPLSHWLSRLAKTFVFLPWASVRVG